jgi:hypothetical protein
MCTRHGVYYTLRIGQNNIYPDCIWPYILVILCRKFCTCTVYMWSWPTLGIPNITLHKWWPRACKENSFNSTTSILQTGQADLSIDKHTPEAVISTASVLILRRLIHTLTSTWAGVFPVALATSCTSASFRGWGSSGFLPIMSAE